MPLAGHGLRPAPLRRRASRPQLKRDPLDGALDSCMARFAAKLLFRFRPPNGGKKSSRFLCEERIVTFIAPSATKALSRAKRLARQGAHSFQVVGGGRAHFEPVGVIELMELGVETGPGEVWWDIYVRKVSGRRTKLVPAERSLRIFTDGGSQRQRKSGRGRREQFR